MRPLSGLAAHVRCASRPRPTIRTPTRPRPGRSTTSSARSSATTSASGKHAAIRTRFPPEPNGYLHIGHAKAICLNFGIAGEFGGSCNLRFDDTNPAREDPEYVAAIQDDVRWLGFEWAALRHASDYFEVYLPGGGKAHPRRRLAYV